MYLGYLLIAAIFIGPIVFLFVSSLKPYAQIESDMSNIRAFIPTETCHWITISMLL